MELTREEKISFIIKTERRMLEAMFNGHKLSGDDQFEEDRKIIAEYRKELGLIRNDYQSPDKKQ